MTSSPCYYDVTNPVTMTSSPCYYDVTNPATMTSSPCYYDVTNPVAMVTMTSSPLFAGKLFQISTVDNVNLKVLHVYGMLEPSLLSS